MKILAPGQFFATFAALTGVFSSAGSLAQLVEHNTFNVGVSGSSPERATDKERESTERRFSLLFLYRDEHSYVYTQAGV